MGESYENLLKAIRHCQESLDKYTENRNEGKLLQYLQKLYKLPIKVVHLEQTGVGRTVNGLRKLGGDVGDSAKGLVAKWKEMVVGEQEEEEEEDDDEDDEDEDGYQTGEEHSHSDSDEKNEKGRDSSHRNRTDDRVRNSKESRSDSKSSKEKEKHKHNGHSKDKSHKRKSDSSSEDESPKKRPRKTDDEDRHKSRSESEHRHKSRSEDEDRHKSRNEGEGRHKSRSDEDRHKSRSDNEDRHKSRSDNEDRHKSRRKVESDSEDESKIKEKKHKSDKYKAKKSRDSSLENEKSSKSKEKHKEIVKDKHKEKREDSKRHESGSKTKDSEKSREKARGKNDEKKSKGPKKNLDGSLLKNGIDSGMGASFAEALGMCGEPSSSKVSVKKKTSEKKDKPAAKIEDPVPKLLKEPTIPIIESIDLNLASLLPPITPNLSSLLPPITPNLSSLLPSITPNYRPLGNLISPDLQSKKFMSESEALSNSITSKNQRTKVYSGNKIVYTKVPSLFEMCIRILQDNIDALEYTGGVPYSVLKPILEKANPNQLYLLEHHNPYLIQDTDDLWQLHCQKEFRNKRREEMETWREMYLRCLDERDAKLKALTANIKQAQDKSLPVRMTKLAYVDAVAKPPRNIARKQAKNGTAFDVRKPSMTPSAKLSSLATAGEAGKVSVPNPGSRAAERSGTHAVKPKKAPLMLKSISSFKNRFKR